MRAVNVRQGCSVCLFIFRFSRLLLQPGPNLSRRRVQGGNLIAVPEEDGGNALWCKKFKMLVTHAGTVSSVADMCRVLRHQVKMRKKGMLPLYRTGQYSRGLCFHCSI